MRKLLLFVLFYCQCLGLYAQAEKFVILKDKNDLLLVGKQTYFMEDKEGKMSIQDILTPENQAKFVLNKKDIFARAATRSAFWFRFSFQNQSDEDAWAEVSTKKAWYIDFYAPDSAGSYGKPYLTGTMRPENEKYYNIVNAFWLPLAKAENRQVKTYFIRIATQATFEVPLQVGTIRSLYKNKSLNEYLMAGFVGALMLMFLYNSFLYISTKDHIYVLYLGYLLSVTLVSTYSNGYSLFPTGITWTSYYFLFWSAPLYFFVGLFCIQYLQLGKHLPWIKRLILLEILILSGVYPLLRIAGVELVVLTASHQLFVLLLTLTCLLTSYYLVVKRHKYAHFYALGWTFLVASTITYLAVINGLLPFNPINRNAVYLGTFIEVWMFSLALGDRINLIRRERRLSQKALLAQTQENEKLVREQNEVLEQKVQERTLQIAKQATELRKLNVFKDRLFSIIAHDLRNPVAALRNTIDILDPEMLNTDELTFIKAELGRQFSSVDFTLNNLLVWAKNEMQGEGAKQEKINAYKIVEENMALFAPMLFTKEIQFQNTISPDIKIWADLNHVRFIFRNLINNAIKFSENNGLITITAMEKDRLTTLTVQDNGTGIKVEKQQKLFDIHTNYSTDGTAGEKGTGLGLILCKEFVEKNGGNIWVKSEVGKGSIFYFTLPKG